MRTPLLLRRSAAGLVALLAAACGPEAAAPPRAAPPTSAPAAAPAPACLSIVGWNDVHGQLTPEDVYIDLGRVPAGGVSALADEVALVRARGDSVVLLDAGDLFTGPLASSLAEGAPIIAAYNAMGVDAAALGNHEFDFGPAGYDRPIAAPGKGDAAGPDGPRGALLARMHEAHFPFLAANLRRSDGAPMAWPNHAPSTTVKRGGFTVGVVGYTTVETPTTTLKPNVTDLDFARGAAASVAAEIRGLRASGASPVVLLAHASLEGDLPQQLDDPSDPQGARRSGEIASLLDGLGDDRPDLVIAGHRHAWMLGRVRGVPIVSSDQHGVGLSVSRFCRSTPDAAPALQGIEREVAVASHPPESALGREVEAAVAPWIERVRAEAEAQVTRLPSACAAQGPNGTAMAEQVARAVAEHAADAEKPPAGAAVVGLVNSGGQRAPLPAGALRFGDFYATFPFENAVAVCGTTRAGLERVIRTSLTKPSARERFPFGIAGAEVTVARVAGGGLELRSMRLEGDKARKKTSPSDPVWLTTSDFVLWGGDGLLEGVTCAPAVSSSLRVRDAWRGVLEREAGGCAGPPKNIHVTGG